MLEIFNLSRQRAAILENAFDISETQRINAINTFQFSLPMDDPKITYCNPLWLVRYNKGDLYRIIKRDDSQTEREIAVFECEHVISLLLNSVMPGWVEIGNIGVYTRTVLQYVLSGQSNWILDECDFSRQFLYGWSWENRLAALFGIPERFTEPYMFRFDTSVFPYRVSLKRLNPAATPVAIIRKKHNQISLTKNIDYTQLFTRIYPLGAGEGVNQLDIRSVNNGVNYLQSPKSITDKYGIIEYAWIDRRYTHAESLMQSAQAMLEAAQEPYEEYSVDFLGDHEVGDIVKFAGGRQSYIIEKRTTYSDAKRHGYKKQDNKESYIVERKTSYSEAVRYVYKIANKPKDIASSLADIADRQRVEMAYSQGASQLWGDSIEQNADPTTPAAIRIRFPKDAEFINFVELHVSLSSYRSDFTATGGGGGTSKTTDGGGGTNTTSGASVSANVNTSDGGSATTSSYQFPATETSSSTALNPQNTTPDYNDPGGVGNSNHNHGMKKMGDENNMFLAIVNSANVIIGRTGFVPSGAHVHQAHTHTVTIPGHSHTVQIPGHSHSINIPSHTHSVSIASHSHNFTLLDHTHEMTPKITFYGSPTGFTLQIDSKTIGYFASTDWEREIAKDLQDNTYGGRIPRDRWITLRVFPNTHARVSITYFVKAFVQSRGNMTV